MTSSPSVTRGCSCDGDNYIMYQAHGLSMHAHSAALYKNEKIEKFLSVFTNWTSLGGYRNNDVITLTVGALFMI